MKVFIQELVFLIKRSMHTLKVSYAKMLEVVMICKVMKEKVIYHRVTLSAMSYNSTSTPRFVAIIRMS